MITHWYPPKFIDLGLSITIDTFGLVSHTFHRAYYFDVVGISQIQKRVGSAFTANSRPFSSRWWITICLTGVGLGLTASVKWVGLFTIALIGFFTINQLWTLVCDGSIPLRVFYRHFIARVMALVVIPVCIYMFCFQVHFLLLSKMGWDENEIDSRPWFFFYVS